jgi:hypothetical protein
MDYRRRTVGDELRVESLRIYALYTRYKDRQLVVNRKYQRKLVWDLSEKQMFIDTLIKGFPVPLILFASYKVDTENEKFNPKTGRGGLTVYEIIDGMQRIDAIISFILGDFSVEYEGEQRYFNAQDVAGAAHGASDRTENLLPGDICNDFLDYALPTSVTERCEKDVEEIFRRINSSGRKLSSQDLRQAGVLGGFSDLVRITASKIRGDYSEADKIGIEKMHELSISGRGLDYGIQISNIFWVKHGIISNKSIRESRDEELIAKIYYCWIQGLDASVASKTLTELYDVGSKKYQVVEDALNEPGASQKFEEDFSRCMATIRKVLECCGLSFSEWFFKKQNACNKDYVFLVFFLSLSDLLKKGYVIKDTSSFAKLLKYAGDDTLGDLSGSKDCSIRGELRCNLIKKLQTSMLKEMCKSDEVIAESDREIKRIIESSCSEDQMHDFKIGVTSLDTLQFNDTLVEKFAKTLTAMLNTNPFKEVYIIVGVADNHRDVVKFQKHYGVTATKCNECYLTGIESEAKRYYGGVEQYVSKIRDVLLEAPISDKLKFYVKSHMKPGMCEGKMLLVIRAKSDKPEFYDGEFYVRNCSNNEKLTIGSEEFDEALERFRLNPTPFPTK